MAEKGEIKSFHFIESDITFLKRRYNYLVLGLICVFFALGQYIYFLTHPNIINNQDFILRIYLFLLISFGIIVVFKVIQNRKMKKFEIKGNKFLNVSKNENNWIEIHRIKKLKVNKTGFASNIMIIYDGNKKCDIEFLLKEEIERIINFLLINNITIENVNRL